jgi:hypothetical protein
VAGVAIGGLGAALPGRAVPALAALFDPVAGSVELVDQTLAGLGGVEAGHSVGRGDHRAARNRGPSLLLQPNLHKNFLNSLDLGR